MGKLDATTFGSIFTNKGAFARGWHRVSVTVGVIALIVFGMRPTCYQENGAACGSAGLSCPAGTLQVCQDRCVKVVGLGKACAPYETQDCAHPAGNICNPALALDCQNGKCVSSTSGAGSECGTQCIEGTYCGPDMFCKAFFPLNWPCNDAHRCDLGLVCERPGGVQSALFDGICRKPCGAGGATTSCPCSHTATGSPAVYTCNANNNCCVATGQACGGTGECCTATDVCSKSNTCLNCVGDACSLANQGPTGSQRQFCEVDSDCCDSHSHCVGTAGSKICHCQFVGQTCTADTDCCGTDGACLLPNGTPGTPTNPGLCYGRDALHNGQFSADPNVVGTGCLGYPPAAPQGGGGTGTNQEDADCTTSADCVSGLTCVVSVANINSYKHKCHDLNLPLGQGEPCTFYIGGSNSNGISPGLCKSGLTCRTDLCLP